MGTVTKLKEKNLPVIPVGYKVMIALLPKKDATEGGVILTEDLQAREQTAAIMGNVIAMGPEAYLDKTKFPAGPRCKIGDWIMMKSFSGRRFKVGGQEFRLIDDDAVDAVVPDPRVIERAF